MCVFASRTMCVVLFTSSSGMPLLYTNLRHHIQYLVWISDIPSRTKTSQSPGKTASAESNILDLSFQHHYINVHQCRTKSVLPPLWRGILVTPLPTGPGSAKLYFQICWKCFFNFQRGKMTFFTKVPYWRSWVLVYSRANIDCALHFDISRQLREEKKHFISLIL